MMKYRCSLALLLLPALPLLAAQSGTGSGEATLLSGRLEKQLAEISALDAEIQSLSQRLGREGTPLPRRAPERPAPPPEPVPVQPADPTPPVVAPVTPPVAPPEPSVRPAIPIPEAEPPTAPPVPPVSPPVVAVAPVPVAPPPPIEVTPPAPVAVIPDPVPTPPAQPPTVAVSPPEPAPPVPAVGGESPARASSGGGYAVVAGDTLSAIARKHNISLAALQKANPGIEPSKLKLGQKLVIPGHGTPSPEPVVTATPTAPVVSGPLFYEVRPGDTLHGIARRAGTSVSSLSQENGITNPESLKIGQKLRLPAGSKVPTAAPAGDGESLPSRPPTPGTHVVKPGDTLSSISRETGTPLEELRKVNNLKDDTIHPGQSLKVRRGKTDSAAPTGNSGASVMPSTSSARTTAIAAVPNAAQSGPSAQAASNAQATEMAEYTVKNGDSIFSIARRYFMSRDELAAMNQLPVDAPLQAGQKLRLPATLVAGARMAESESMAR